jgi:hypothetical protein
VILGGWIYDIPGDDDGELASLLLVEALERSEHDGCPDAWPLYLSPGGDA